MRKDMVTRGVDGTKARVKIVSKTTDLISVKEVLLPKDLTGDEKKLNKAITKLLEGDEILVRVESAEVIHKLYGMETATFMANAIELDPVTRRPLTEDSDPTDSVEA